MKTRFKTSNSFLRLLIEDTATNKNWNDIEAFYFKLLKSHEEMSEVLGLYTDFEEIKKKLLVYKGNIDEIFKSIGTFHEFFNTQYFNKGNKNNSLILNFNDTETLSIYNLNPMPQ
mgnify:CR=1 FL=1